MVSKPLPQVDEIVMQVYRGPLERKPWSSFLQTLRHRLKCDISGMSLIPGQIGSFPHIELNRSILVSVEVAKKIARVHPRLVHLDLLGNALKEPGDIFTLDEISPWNELKNNEFYLKVLKPNGIRYQLGMCFGEPLGWHCHVGLMNGEDKTDFGEAEKAFLQAIRPHLELSLEIYALIRLNEMEKEIYEATLDCLTVATFIIDGKGQVICSNSTARILLSGSGDLAINQGRLYLTHTTSNRHFQDIITQALIFHQQNPSGTFVEALSIEIQNGENMGLLVRSVSTTQIHQDEASPCVIIYLDQTDRQKMPKEKFVAQLLGLTPSEATLAILLSQGFTLVESANMLGITENSVRTYVKNIFSKTGVSRQTDLVRLILKSVALLA